MDESQVKNKKKGGDGSFAAWLAEMIVRRRRWIVAVFLLSCLFSLFATFFVNVNYDLTEYLPKDARSRLGLDVMEREFGYPGTARIMLKDVTLYEAKQYKDLLKEVDGVDQILWCDTKVNVYAGEEFINESDIRDYYRDGCAVMDVTFAEADGSERTSRAIEEMEAITGDKGCFVGMAVQSKALEETLAREMERILVVAIIMIFTVLCISTTAWSEPILFLLVMGVAVLLNKGTNVFIGTISFMTDNVAIILQLATSMDYSIFLLDEFSKAREQGASDEEAVKKAVEEAVNSIFASSLTTVVGFLALTTMTFTIGFDLGLVLAKGIVFSLLTVIFFMPSLILKFARWNDKSRHRPFFPSFEGFGKAVYKVRYGALILLALVTPFAYVAQGMNEFLYGNSSVGAAEGTKVYENEQEIIRIFGRSNMMLAVYPNTSPALEREMTERLEELPYVKNVTSMANTLPEGIPEEFLPESLMSELHTKDFCRMLIYIRTKEESELAFQCSDEIQGILAEYYPEGSYLVGQTPSTQDIKVAITSDNLKVNAWSLAGVFLVIMFNFRSLIIPVLVMIPIKAATFINMAVPYLAGDHLVYMGYIIVSSIQLGATVDYSILLTNNYMKERKNLPKKEACIQAVSQSCSSILTSGGIITLAGYIVHLISTTAAIGDLGHLIGRGGLYSMILVLTVLPSLLVLFDRLFIEKKKELKDRKQSGKRIGKHSEVQNEA